MAIGAFFAANLIPLHWSFATLIAACAALLPFIHILRKRAKRMLKIVQQLPDTLDLIARALKAGHAFPGGPADGR